MTEAEAIMFALRIWGSIGAIVAAVFLTIGMDRIDEDARGAYVFRPLLIPGVLVIWPLVLWRWYVCETGREDAARRHLPPRRAHFAIGMLLPLGIALVILAGLNSRQTWPSHIAPVQISKPLEASE